MIIKKIFSKRFEAAFLAVTFLCTSLTGCSNQGIVDETKYGTLFDAQHVSELSITISREDWNTMVGVPIEKKYVPCDIEWDGETCSNAGIRLKGNTSLIGVADYNSFRYSYKIEMDHYDQNAALAGLDKLILNNIYEDPSYMAEYLAYRCYEHLGIPTPYFSFVNISINGQPWGLYLAIEAIEDSYIDRNNIPSVQIYKPENSIIDQIHPQQGADDPDGGADLRYRDNVVESYPNIFENAVFKPSVEDEQRVITALQHLEAGQELEGYIDVDECLKYFAALTFTNNPDCYYSPAVCNYYLCENGGVLSVLPWDLNRSFINYTEDDVTYYVNTPVDDPWDCVLGVTIGQISNASDRPLFQKLIEIPEYRQRYYDDLNELCDWVLDGGFLAEMKEIREQITPCVKSDPTRFYTYDSYEYAVDNLELYIRLRAQSVRRQLNGQISTDSGSRSLSTILVDGSGGVKDSMKILTKN